MDTQAATPAGGAAGASWAWAGAAAQPRQAATAASAASSAVRIGGPLRLEHVVLARALRRGQLRVDVAVHRGVAGRLAVQRRVGTAVAHGLGAVDAGLGERAAHLAQRLGADLADVV